MHRFVILEGVDQGKTLELSNETCFVGRSSRNQLKLKDRRVSNRHLKVFKRRGKLFVEDLNSTNGTRVNGERIQPGEAFEVVEGDVVRLSRVRMRLETLPTRSPFEVAIASAGLRDGMGGDLEASDSERRRPTEYGTQLIRDVSRLMKGSIHLHSFCRRVLVQILKNLPRIDTAVLVYVDPLKQGVKNKTLVLYSRPEAGYSRGSVVSENIVDHVLENGKPIQLHNAASQYAGCPGTEKDKHNIRSILCLPLLSNSVVRGALYVHSVSNPRGFRKEDFLILDTLGTSLALVFENNLIRQDRRALIQRRLPQAASSRAGPS